MQKPASKESIHEVLPSKLKKGGIFIGNLNAAQNSDILLSNSGIISENNIRAIISVAKGAFLSHSKEILPNYLYIPAYDHPDFDLTEYFDKSYEFIEKASKKSNILVHCKAGISRSATIVIAYLMRKQNKSWVEAYRQIKELRPIIEPNNGFLRQLKHFEDNVLKNNNKVTNVQCNVLINKSGNSCKESKGTKTKQNKSQEKHKNKWKDRDQQIRTSRANGSQTTRTKSAAKARYRYKPNNSTEKRSSIPYVINY